MIDEKIKDLINRDLDGLLSPEEQDQLKTYLAQNEQARHYYQKMRQMTEFLNQVPEVPAPPSLKENILNQIGASHSVPNVKREKFTIFSAFSEWFRVFTAKPPYAFALGIAISAIIFTIIALQTMHPEPQTNLPVSGTIKTAQQTIPINLPVVQGKIEFTSRGALSVLNVVLNPQEEIALTIEYDPNTLRIKDIEPPAIGKYELKQEAGKIVVRSQQKLAIDFNFQHLKPSAQLSTSLEVGGRVIFRKKIIY